MMVPTIHNSGTSRETLIDELLHAKEALRLAKAALGRTRPSGRDYYPQGASAINQALQEHDNRITRLAEISGELDEVLQAICDA